MTGGSFFTNRFSLCLIASRCKKAQEDLFVKNFALKELNYAIDTFKSNKSADGDLIFGEMFKHLGNKIKLLLLIILNTSWKPGKLPNVWKTSIIVPVLKPGKTATQ